MTGLTPGTDYFFEVKATNSAGSSPQSNPSLVPAVADRTGGEHRSRCPDDRHGLGAESDVGHGDVDGSGE